MTAEASRPCLSAVFVDYDNIYLSLKRKDDEVAKRFAKDAAVWLEALALGHLITPTQPGGPDVHRRLVMNRCYGNPAPRRNARDNSTDMFSFPFVRHHLLRAGFEIVDCPPLTQQLKNASDIRMVMDIRDYLVHDTYFDEFIIISGDADFTPVLHRLRAHARRTVIYSNDYTATPFRAICDGEIREEDLIALLMQGELPVSNPVEPVVRSQPTEADKAALRATILQEVVGAVRTADAPVPIETLADRAQRTLGHDKTSGTNWAGHGGFLAFLQANLPADIRLSDDPPYVARDMTREPATTSDVGVTQTPTAASTVPSDVSRAPAAAVLQVVAGTHATSAEAQPASIASQELVPQTPPPPIPPIPSAAIAADFSSPVTNTAPAIDFPSEPVTTAPVVSAGPPSSSASFAPAADPAASATSAAPATSSASTRAPSRPLDLQASIARIHDASQAPPLGPPQYRSLFESMAEEISENGLSGAQTITNIIARSKSNGVEIRRDDVRFALDVVSEADPWFEQGASANLFAGRFRNFVVARCRTQGLKLSVEELDLIEAWFAGGTASPLGAIEAEADRAWRSTEQSASSTGDAGQDMGSGSDDGDMPRFVRA